MCLVSCVTSAAVGDSGVSGLGRDPRCRVYADILHIVWPQEASRSALERGFTSRPWSLHSVPSCAVVAHCTLRTRDGLEVAVGHSRGVLWPAAGALPMQRERPRRVDDHLEHRRKVEPARRLAVDARNLVAELDLARQLDRPRPALELGECRDLNAVAVGRVLQHHPEPRLLEGGLEGDRRLPGVQHRLQLRHVQPGGQREVRGVVGVHRVLLPQQRRREPYLGLAVALVPERPAAALRAEREADRAGGGRRDEV
mmetsp:Transcript_39847/g.128108  ORF Transcript_39847/g.128108 Transcript_39847/m.128108 type:complete len:255 (+) Transcript_39847:33-797(+)